MQRPVRHRFPCSRPIKPTPSVNFLRELIRPAAALPEADVGLVGLVGLPLDFGTVLEGGRAGAAHAPDAIRGELRGYHKTCNLEYGLNLASLRIAAPGNLALRHADHARNHALIRPQLAALRRQYPRVVVLGGLHDGTYSTVRGLFDASGGQPVGGLNFDAHADVRNKPVISSGTPFGKLLREGFWQASGSPKSTCSTTGTIRRRAWPPPSSPLLSPA